MIDYDNIAKQAIMELGEAGCMISLPLTLRFTMIGGMIIAVGKATEPLIQTIRMVANLGCCETPGCCPDDPMCTAMEAKSALVWAVEQGLIDEIFEEASDDD